MDDKKLKELLENFTGELQDVPYDANNQKRGIEKIGVMSEDSKKLYTLVFKKFEEIEKLIVKDKEILNNLREELAYLNDYFVRNIRADLPKKYKNSKIVYKKGWEIWYDGEKKVIFEPYWESKEF